MTFLVVKFVAATYGTPKKSMKKVKKDDKEELIAKLSSMLEPNNL